MAQPLNMFTPKPQTANVVSGGASASGGKNGLFAEGAEGGFDQLIAALLGVDTPTEQSDATAPIQSQTSISQTSSVSLEGLIDVDALLQAADKPAEGGDSPDPLAALLQGLLASLNDLATPTGTESTLSPDALEKLGKISEAISSLLTTIEQQTGQGPAAPNNGGPNSQAPDIAKIPPGQLDQLLKLSEALRALQTSSPEVSELDKAKLDQLLQRAETLIRGPISATTPSASQAVDPEVNNVVALLFGEKDGGKAAGNKGGVSDVARDLPAALLAGDGQPKKPELSALQALTPETAANAKKIDASQQANQLAQTNADADNPLNSQNAAVASVIGKTPAPGVAGSVSASASAVAAVAGIAADADAPIGEAKQDPLLLAQTQAAASQKANFAAQLRATSASYNSPSANLNMPHIAVEIARNVGLGHTRFQIRLDPPEMGKIDVAMDMDAAGNLNARLTVERAETLDLLQRDARALERALAQSGLDGARTNLQFSLKQNPFSQSGQHNQGQHDFVQAQTQDDSSAQPEVNTSMMAQLYRGNLSPGGINLWV